MQDPVSLKCVLTFQGSHESRPLDWYDNFRFYSREYCGLPNLVHAGFRDQLRAHVQHEDFEPQIKSKLGKCAEVTVSGHSQGAAMGLLFSACVNSANAGDKDFETVKWVKETPVRMEPFVEPSVKGPVSYPNGRTPYDE